MTSPLACPALPPAQDPHGSPACVGTLVPAHAEAADCGPPARDARGRVHRLALMPVSFLLVTFFSLRAMAAPSGLGNIVAFGQEILDFLAGPLAVVALGIGLAIFAYGLMFQRQDAFGGAVRWCLAGVILFSIDAIVGWLQTAAA